MTWLEFFASIIGALAWPVTLLLVVLVFESPIRDLLGNIRRLRWNNLEAFVEKTQEVQEEVRVAGEELQTPEPPQEPPVEEENIFERNFALAEFSPRGAIIEAWLLLEGEIMGVPGVLAGIMGAEAPARGYLARTPIDRVVLELVDSSVLSRGMISWVRDLRELRNTIVHGRETDVDTESARSYLVSVQGVRGFIKAQVATYLERWRLDQLEQLDHPRSE